MARILEIKDKRGKIIYLTDERYMHIKKHPEMQDSLRLIEQAVKSPDKIDKYSLDPNIRYYYLYLKYRKSKARHLRVIVKYLNGEGFIITAYFVIKT